MGVPRLQCQKLSSPCISNLVPESVGRQSYSTSSSLKFQNHNPTQQSPIMSSQPSSSATSPTAPGIGTPKKEEFCYRQYELADEEIDSEDEAGEEENNLLMVVGGRVVQGQGACEAGKEPSAGPSGPGNKESSAQSPSATQPSSAPHPPPASKSTSRKPTTETFSFLILGDQDAGKSTFLHSFSRHEDRNFTRLQSFLPTITSSFVNACFKEREAGSQTYSGSGDGAMQGGDASSTTGLPKYLDTDIGKATITITAESFAFFCTEFSLGARAKETTRFVVLELHEMGGDHLDREEFEFYISLMHLHSKMLSYSSTARDSASTPLDMNALMLEENLRQSLRVLSKVSNIAYFVNCETVEEMNSFDSDEGGYDLLKRRIRFLEMVCGKAGEISFYCSRLEGHGDCGEGNADELTKSSNAHASPRPGGNSMEVEEKAQEADVTPVANSLPQRNRRKRRGKMEEEAESAHEMPREPEGVPSSSSLTSEVTLRPFEDEFGSYWSEEKSELLRLEELPRFNTIREFLVGEFFTDSPPNSGNTQRLSVETSYRFVCGGIHPTQSLILTTKDGQLSSRIAVCSVVLVLVRLLRNYEKSVLGKSLGNSANDENQRKRRKQSDDGKDGNDGMQVEPSASRDSSFTEFVELFFLCCRELRIKSMNDSHFSAESDPSGGGPAGALKSISISNSNWLQFLSDKITISPTVSHQFANGVELLRNPEIGIVFEVGMELVLVLCSGGDGGGETRLCYVSFSRASDCPKDASAEDTSSEPQFNLPCYPPLFDLVTCSAIARNIGVKMSEKTISSTPLINSPLLLEQLAPIKSQILEELFRTRDATYLTDLVVVERLIKSIIESSSTVSVSSSSLTSLETSQAPPNSGSVDSEELLLSRESFGMLLGMVESEVGVSWKRMDSERIFLQPPPGTRRIVVQVRSE